MAPDPATDGPWRELYERMLTIRIFEEHVNQLYTTAKMPGLAHLYSG
jgi:pyruvate dehydrogenase E1 component alpha subunit